MVKSIVPLLPVEFVTGETQGKCGAAFFLQSGPLNLAFRKVCFTYLAMQLDQLGYGKQALFAGRVSEDFDAVTGEIYFTIDASTERSRLLFRGKVTVEYVHSPNQPREMCCARILTPESLQAQTPLLPRPRVQQLKLTTINRLNQYRAKLRERDIELHLVCVDPDLAVFAATSRQRILSTAETEVFRKTLSELLRGEVKTIKVRRLGIGLSNPVPITRAATIDNRPPYLKSRI